MKSKNFIKVKMECFICCEVIPENQKTLWIHLADAPSAPLCLGCGPKQMRDADIWNCIIVAVMGTVISVQMMFFMNDEEYKHALNLFMYPRIFVTLLLVAYPVYLTLRSSYRLYMNEYHLIGKNK